MCIRTVCAMQHMHTYVDGCDEHTYTMRAYILYSECIQTSTHMMYSTYLCHCIPGIQSLFNRHWPLDSFPLCHHSCGCQGFPYFSGTDCHQCRNYIKRSKAEEWNEWQALPPCICVSPLVATSPNLRISSFLLMLATSLMCSRVLSASILMSPR